MFRRDAEFEKDSNVVKKTSSFNLPIRRESSGNRKVPSESLIWICFTSAFFIEEADEWREDAWLMIYRHSVLHFFMITKRLERILECLPEDWGNCYEHVTICCTMENQRRVDKWLPLYREQTIAANVPFHFKQTGAHFRKEGRLYNIPRQLQMQQTHRAGIDYQT